MQGVGCARSECLRRVTRVLCVLLGAEGGAQHQHHPSLCPRHVVAVGLAVGPAGEVHAAAAALHVVDEAVAVVVAQLEALVVCWEPSKASIRTS